jgi:hypothetical protein
MQAAEQIAQLQVEQAGVTSERKQADADLGPVRYPATLLHATDECHLRMARRADALHYIEAANRKKMAADAMHKLTNEK